MDEYQDMRLVAQELLRAAGAMEVGSLTEALVARGFDVDRDVVSDELLDEFDPDGDQLVFAAFPLSGDRLCDVDFLVQGVVLTHRITEEERRTGVVTSAPDLDLASFMSPDASTVHLVGGLQLHGDAGTLAGPPGWLPDDPVLVLTAVEEDNWAVSGLAATPATDPDAVALLELAQHNVLSDNDIPELGVVVVEALSMDPQLFRQPTAPLGDLLAETDLRLTDVGFLLAPGDPQTTDGLFSMLHGDGEDDPFDDAFDDALDNLSEHLMLDHMLQFDEAEAVEEIGEALVDVCVNVIDALTERNLDPDDIAGMATAISPVDLVAALLGDRPELADMLVLILGNDRAVTAYLHDVIGVDPLMAASTLALMRLTEVKLDRRGRANRHWFTAKLLEFGHDEPTDIERELRSAIGVDDGHALAMFDLARYKSDRGEAGAALGLLRQLEADPTDRPWIEVLERHASPGPTSAGRNDPCPCGSGRKHKICCAARGGWPLAERVSWLLLKLVMHAWSPPVAELLMAATDEMVDPDDVLEDPILRTMAFHEGGVMADFLRLRGVLLPADERELLREWNNVTASAYRVMSTSSSGGIELLDRRTGDTVSVVDAAISSSLEVDDVVLAWVLPTSDGPELSGGAVLTAPEAERTSLLELIDTNPDATDLFGWLDRLHTTG